MYLPEGHDFPKKNSKRPDIRFGSEDAVEEGLGWHPLDGQHRLAAFAVIVRSVYIPGHAEVGNFDNPAGPLGGEQAIPRRNVPMDKAILLHIFAPLGDVDGAQEEIAHAQRRGALLKGMRQAQGQFDRGKALQRKNNMQAIK